VCASRSGNVRNLSQFPHFVTFARGSEWGRSLVESGRIASVAHIQTAHASMAHVESKPGLRPLENVVLPQISETEIARVQDMCSEIVICIQ